MNERFRWRSQASEMCADLANTFLYIAKENKDLGHPIKAAQSAKKAVELKIHSILFRQQAERESTRTG